MRKYLILITLIFLPLSSYCEVIKIGRNIDEVKIAFKKAGYKNTALAMESGSKSSKLEFWNVNEGVIIIRYNIQNQKIESMSYYLTGGGPKLYRKSFSLSVKEFDTKTKEMILIMEKG